MKELTVEQKQKLLEGLASDVKTISGSINHPVGTYEMTALGFSSRITDGKNGDKYFLPFAHGETKASNGKIIDKGFGAFMVDNPDFWASMTVGTSYIFEIAEFDAKDKDGNPVKRKRTVNWR